MTRISAKALAHAAAAMATGVTIALMMAPAYTEIPFAFAMVAALAIFAVGFWGTGVLPPYLVSLVMMLVAILFGIAPAEIVFAGFHSTAFWLVFAGLIIGIALDRTGLANRIAAHLVRLAGASYPRVVIVMAILGVVLAFLIPSSMGRIAIIVPIAASIADRLGLGRGRAGLILVSAFATCNTGWAILPANFLNMILIGATETMYGLSFSYSEYLILLYPVFGLFQAAVIVGLGLAMFPDRTDAETAEQAPPGRMSGKERLLLVILLSLLGLWATDSLHGISPAWVGLAGAVICLLPRLGLVEARDFAERVNYGMLFFLAGILCLAGLFAHSGLADALGRWFIEVASLAPGEPARSYGAVTMTGFLVSILAVASVVIAVMTPLAGSISEATGLPVLVVQMMMIPALTAKFLPYQVPQIMLGMQIGKIPLSTGTRFMATHGVIALFVMIPLNYLWWRIIGYL